MDKFKSATEVIDRAIASGVVTSVDMLEATLRIDNNEGAIKGRLVSYILKNHLDEELEMHLMDEMGYDPMLHRAQVAHDGTITF